MRSLERCELPRSPGCAVDVLPRESDAVHDLAAKVEPHLREMADEHWA